MNLVHFEGGSSVSGCNFYNNSQATPSEARTQLLIADMSNLLLCIAQLLPSVCDDAEEYMGICLNTRSKILRDIHCKSQELFYCLILKGAPLDNLKRVIKEEAFQNLEK